MHVARLAERQTKFEQWTVVVGLVAVVIARKTPTRRGECTQPPVNLIVHIDTRLQGVEALGLIVRVLVEGLHVIVTHITAQTPFGRQLEILT